jgi:hypothetical protein
VSAGRSGLPSLLLSASCSSMYGFSKVLLDSGNIWALYEHGDQEHYMTIQLGVRDGLYDKTFIARSQRCIC